MRSVEPLYDTWPAFPGRTGATEILASRSPGPRRTSARPAGRIVLERTNIGFFKLGPNRLRIEFTLRNESREASTPTVARVRAAPLGAFVSWEPLTRLTVPELPPGESTTLRLDTAPPFERTSRGPNPVLAWLLRAAGLRLPREHNVHWAGNIDVFVRGREVERHMAMSLRLAAGAFNMADFIVGDRDDDYMFDVTGDVAGWDIRLRDHAPLFSWKGCVALGSWIPLRARRLVWLCAKPPQLCTGGNVNVHVRQRSTGRDAVVEFGFQT